MIADLLSNQEFKDLEKEYKFLSRARGKTIDQIDCVIVDIETTGLEPTIHEITEIGAIRLKGKEFLEVFSTLIKPIQPISHKITQLTGINDEMVKDAPAAAQALPGFLEFIGNTTLIAHNASFDIPFLQQAIKRFLGKELENKSACTVKLSRHLLPQLTNHKLHTVAAHFGFEIVNRHRAMGDCEVTFQVWTKLLDMLQEKGIKTNRDLDVLMQRL